MRTPLIQQVLILILMEDTLRELKLFMMIFYQQECLNPYSNGRYSTRCCCSSRPCSWLLVLILILMEDTLRVKKSLANHICKLCLNLYSNGRYSTRQPSFCNLRVARSLNPYSNGRYSTRAARI